MSHPEFKRRHHTLLDELTREYVQMLPLLERPPFATIQVGNFKNVKALRQALSDNNRKVSDWGNDILGRITLVSEPTTIDLYKATNAELGLTQGGTVAQTFEAIAKIGGEKLPAESGPQYRLQNSDQKLGEWELMYMDPITDRYGDPSVFRVERDEGGLWLCGGAADPDDIYYAEDVWVFGRKRPVAA
jgi:hypothetical protein